MNYQKSIMIVDDDKIILDSLVEFLRLEGFECFGAGTVKESAAIMEKQNPGIVILDVNLPDGNGFDALDVIKSDNPQTVVIMITGYGTIESAVQAIKRGAYDYLTKPIIDDELRLAIERAIKQQNLISENESLRLQLEQKYSLDNIISHDYKMARIFDLIEAVADSKTTILMTGPSGTGKSMLARAIHHRSSRKNKPFVEVSCGALPETLLESELFGHIKGSFTGAVTNKEGKFLAANEGTIFLDEISSASPGLQVKLLRVLQERRFEPVGSNKTETVDIRVLLASNKNLSEEVKQGRFREDLFYRINVVTIDLPQLSERVGDIELLARHFMQIYCKQHKRDKIGITEDARRFLEKYSWPGNVRELENVIERAVLLSKDKFITADDLPETVKEPVNQHQKKFEFKSLREALEEPEKRIIRQALESNHWNRHLTAKALKLDRSTLFKKMKKYGLYDEAEKLGLL